MTAQEIQKRNLRAQKLRVIQVDDGAYYVESSEGKICYRVSSSICRVPVLSGGNVLWFNRIFLNALGSSLCHAIAFYSAIIENRFSR